MKHTTKPKTEFRWTWRDIDALRKQIVGLRSVDRITGCWTSAHYKYPTIEIEGKSVQLRVVSAMVFNNTKRSSPKSPIYAACRNAECFNPEHLSRTRQPLRKPADFVAVRKCRRCKTSPAEWKAQFCCICGPIHRKEQAAELSRRSRCRLDVREREREAGKRYRAKHRDKILERTRRDYKKNYYRYQYGMSRDDVEKMITVQNGCCAICRLREKLDIDHDHGTGRVRGMLCGSCNRGLGMFKDSSDLLLSAVAYLDSNGGVAK